MIRRFLGDEQSTAVVILRNGRAALALGSPTLADLGFLTRYAPLSRLFSR